MNVADDGSSGYFPKTMTNGGRDVKTLVNNRRVKLIYSPGMGAWTYHVVVPGTKKLGGSWGYTKVSGTIDDFKITSRNLAPRKNSDMWLSINAEIRKAIGKSGGDTVTLTLKTIT